MMLVCCLGATTTMAFVSPIVRNNMKTCHHQSTVLSSSSYDKWDNLVDDEEEEYKDLFGPTEIPRDMRYELRNVQRQQKQFDAIREAGGPEVTNDVYVRQPETDVYWFVGKVACVDGVNPTECVGRQYPLIAQHAALLRPLELFLHRDATFEFYLAPGDSEMSVVYNKPDIKFEKLQFDTNDHGRPLLDVQVVLVGFAGEIYESGEEGLRTRRKDDGYALKPEIQSPGGEKTAEEYDEMMQTMKKTPPEDIAEMLQQLTDIERQTQGNELMSKIQDAGGERSAEADNDQMTQQMKNAPPEVMTEMIQQLKDIETERTGKEEEK